jgi:hypothetical protein
MFEIKKIKTNESSDKTMEFIDKNRNWSVKEQKYRFPDAEKCKVPLTECEIYQRGDYIILEHNKIVHYWEFADSNYPYFQMAIELIELDKPKKWKTLDKLISFRAAIRQTEVNCCGYVDDIIRGNKMTLKLFNEFMFLARKQDYEHHGSHTF